MNDRLNVKHKAKKLPEENIGENLGDPVFGDKFLVTTTKEQSIKEKLICWLFFEK